MKKISIVLISFLITLITIALMIVATVQSQPYMLVMFDCSTYRNMFGDNVTWHVSEADAKTLGDARLAEYDIAHVYKPQSQIEFAPLLWVKTDTDCYGGSYREWTQP